MREDSEGPEVAMRETSYPSWKQPVTITIDVGDLPPVMKFSLNTARIRDGWDADKLHAVVACEFDFLGSPVSARVEMDPQRLAEVVVIEFTPPAERDRSAAEADFETACQAAAAGHPDQTAPTLERLVREFPEISKYRITLGRTYLEQRRIDDAEAEMLRGLWLNPRDAGGLTLLGNLYFETDRPLLAIPLYEAALSHQRTKHTLTNLGAAMTAAGELSQANVILRQAVEEFPSFEPARVALEAVDERLAETVGGEE
jgi:tetratricopeptide (TPR) repeat protein